MRRELSRMNPKERVKATYYLSRLMRTVFYVVTKQVHRWTQQHRMVHE